MSKQTGTQGAGVCLHQLAMERWLQLSVEERPYPTDDPMFAAYLRSGNRAPQEYRFLRKWVNDRFNHGLASFEQIRETLHEDAVLSQLKGKSLDEVAGMATRAQNALRDLNKAYAAYVELLGNGKKTEPDSSSGLPSQGGKVVRSSRTAKGRRPQVGRANGLDTEGA